MNLQRFTTGATSIALAVTIMTTPALAATKFSDVPPDHWAAASISKMVDAGIMKGIGNNLFAPEATITNAEFITMIVRQFYSDKVDSEGDTWYSPYMKAANDAGCLAGTNSLSSPTTAINRYDMAQIMYNVMKATGKQMTTLSDTSRVADWAVIPACYQDAVSTCYAMGMLTGTDSAGTFDGERGMSRAQASAAIDRLVGGGTTPSVSTEIPVGAYILTGDNVTLKGRTMGFNREDSRYENGKFILINAMSNSSASIEFINEGYSTLTFTVTTPSDKIQRIDGGGIDGILSDIRLDVHQDPGTTKTYTVDISGIKKFVFSVGNGVMCSGAIIENIYLTK